MSDEVISLDESSGREELDSKHRDRMKFSNRDTDSFIRKFDGAAYGIFGDFCSKRRDSLSGLELKLKKAQMTVGEDLYMSRILLASLFASVLTSLFVSGLLFVVSLFTSISMFVSLSGLLLLPVVFGISISIGYYYPSFIATKRKRKIDQSLPHAVTFMYALSRGGVNLVNIIEKLAENESTYSETSIEYKPVVRQMEFFSKDIQQALDTASRNSPSQKFKDFNGDLTSVLTSGGNLTEFLYDKSEEFLEQARTEQERFIETLALMAEIYVTAFVAAPLFLIIITVILNMLGGGGGSLFRLYSIVYVILPIAMAIFYLAVSTISTDQQKVTEALTYAKKGRDYDEAMEEFGHLYTGKDSVVEEIFKEKKKRTRREILKNPMKSLRKNPATSLYLTGPISILIFIISTILIQPSIEVLKESPTSTTFWLFVLPFLIMMIPLTVLFEYRERRKKNIMDRFPGALKQLASSNSIGLNLQQSLHLVAQNTSGKLGKEMEKVRNDMNWDYKLNKALLKFADNLRIPTLSRTVKLITEANRSTGDIAKVLNVASEDVQKRRALKKERYTQMTLYTAVIIMSFSVYLLVIALLDITFLAQIGELASQTDTTNVSAAGGAGGTGGTQVVGSISLSDVPIQTYKLIFLHSAIIEAIGSGLLAGYLGSNDIRYGLKYTVILLIITMIVFSVI